MMFVQIAILGALALAILLLIYEIVIAENSHPNHRR